MREFLLSKLMNKLIAPLVEEVQLDYPHESIPKITVNQNDHGGGYWHTYDATTGVESNEKIDIDIDHIMNDGWTQAIATALHEIGHDVLDHRSDDPNDLETQRIEECEADHFAAKYINPSALIDYLEKQIDAPHYNDEEYFDNHVGHPHPNDRITALRDEEIQSQPIGVAFNPDCTLKR